MPRAAEPAWRTARAAREHVLPLLVLALVTAGLVQIAVGGPPDAPATLALDAAVAVVTPLPILLLGRFPWAGMILALVGLVVVSLLGWESGLAVTSLAVVLTTFASRGPRAHPVLLCALAGSAVAFNAYEEALATGGGTGPDTFVFGLFGTALAVGLGISLRNHREALVELDQRNRELEALRVLEARQAVAEERVRIARELHDVLAHHVSAILVRAQAAAHVRARRPEETVRALDYTITASAETLAALRHTVGLLRDDGARDETGLVDPARPAPQPTLAEVPDLVAGAREVGLPAALVERGTRQPLPVDLELTAYRIAQEGLTNARRHAPGAAVVVELAWWPGVLELVVVNTAPTEPVPSTPPGGHGFVGMRERVALCGGTLEAGPTAEGGWRLVARLPLSTMEATSAERPAEEVR